MFAKYRARTSVCQNYAKLHPSLTARIFYPHKNQLGEFLLLLPTLNVRFPFLAGNLSFRENEHSPFLYNLGRNREIDLIRDFSIQPPLQLTVHFSKPEIRTVIQSCWPNKNCFSMRFLYFPHLLSAKIKIHCFLCHSMLLYNKELYFTFCKKSVNSLFTGCK